MIDVFFLELINIININMKYLIKLDLLSPEIKLYFNGNTKLQTNVGMIITIILIGLVSYSTYSFGKDIIRKEEPTILIQNKIFQNRPEVALTKDIFPISITIQDFTNQVINDPTMLNFRVSNYEIDNFLSVFNVTESKTVPCKKFDFPKLSEDEFNSTGLHRYSCIDNQNLTLKGYWSERYIKYSKIDFILCKNTTENNNHCKPKEEIFKFINDKVLTANLYVLDTFIDLKDYLTPVKYFVNNIYKGLTTTFTKYFELHVKNIKLSTDDGPIFKELNEILVSTIGRKELDINVSSSELFSFLLFAVEEETINFRTYIKVQTIAANLGGIIKVLFIIGYYINEYFSIIYRNVLVANSIIKDDKFDPFKNFHNIYKQKLCKNNIIVPNRNRRSMLRKSINCKQIIKPQTEPNVINDESLNNTVSIAKIQPGNKIDLKQNNFLKLNEHFSDNKIKKMNMISSKFVEKQMNSSPIYEKIVEIRLSFCEILKLIFSCKYCCCKLNTHLRSKQAILEKYQEEIISKLDVLSIVNTALDIENFKNKLKKKKK